MEYIELDLSKRFGKPVIKGTRIAVEDILNLVANELTVDEIIYDFPELNESQIKACLSYRLDNTQIN